MNLDKENATDQLVDVAAFVLFLLETDADSFTSEEEEEEYQKAWEQAEIRLREALEALKYA